MPDPIESDHLKNAFLGLLPDNWRMWLIGGLLVWYALSNPQAVSFIIGKVYSLIAYVGGKVSSFKIGETSPTATASATAPTDSGIEAPLTAAQSQIAWAVRTKNQAVLDSAITTLKALTASTAALLVLCVVGCSGATASKAVKEDCQYERSHSFGYMPPSPEEKQRMYQAEPTLFQQEPNLAK